MISIITGRPGQGKTFVATLLAYKEWLKGVKIYSNYRLNFGKTYNKVVYWTELDDLLDVKNGLILMDEASVYLNSRNWDKLTPEFQYKLQQHRKDGLNILSTTQSINRVDSVYRELVHNYYKVKKLISIKNFCVFVLYLVDVDELTKVQQRVVSRKLYFLTSRNKDLFDTLQKVDVPVDKKVIIKKYKKCSECGSLKKV
jgi:hypothetical protein